MSVGRQLSKLGYQWAKAWFPYVVLACGIELGAVVLGAAVAFRNAPMAGAQVAMNTVIAQSPWFFFLHNVPIATAMALGFVLFGLPTLGLLGYNGFLLGSTIVKAGGMVGPATTLAMILPHALFELPAFWLAGAVGFRNIHLIWYIAEGNQNRTSVPVCLGQTVIALLFVGALLGVAAVVESQVTIPVARLVANT